MKREEENDRDLTKKEEDRGLETGGSTSREGSPTVEDSVDTHSHDPSSPTLQSSSRSLRSGRKRSRESPSSDHDRRKRKERISENRKKRRGNSRSPSRSPSRSRSYSHSSASPSPSRSRSASPRPISKSHSKGKSRSTSQTTNRTVPPLVTNVSEENNTLNETESDSMRLKQDQTRTALQSAESQLATWRALSQQMTGRKDASFDDVRSSFEKLRQDNGSLRDQLKEAKKRGGEVVNRLTQAEKDIYNLEIYNRDLKENSAKKAMQMRTTFMDPLVNDNFKALQEQVKEYEKKLKQSQEDLKSAKFSAETYEGRQLIAKCRRLHVENEEFGRQLSEEKVHKLEAQLAKERKQNSELHDAIAESHDWVARLDEELEEMQKTIFKLQQVNSKLEGELKRYREKERREKERSEQEKQRKQPSVKSEKS